jgi:hypothetical protein
MESAANLLLRNFRHVLIRAAYDNYTRIRFRADDVEDPRVYFGKANVPSQIKKWRETGGALITWRNTNLEGPHDAILFVECPKTMSAIRGATRNTAHVGVIYIPPSWRLHDETLAYRHRDRPVKLARAQRRMEEVKALELLPELTPASLRRTLRAQGVASQSSSSPESPEAAGRSAGTTD